jgi:DNA-binding IclR family transcriptional regulator
MSIFQHAFSADHGYASNLEELGQYYRLYERMMAFWTELLPNHIHRVTYEHLVDDTEAQVRELLSYCGLEFHEDCLSFHKTSRYVSTPSAGQVRKPMHRGSIGRAMHYRKHLQPLVDALAQPLPSNGATCEDRS